MGQRSFFANAGDLPDSVKKCRIDAPLIRCVKTFALFLENNIIKRLREGNLILDKFDLCSDSTKKDIKK